MKATSISLTLYLLLICFQSVAQKQKIDDFLKLDTILFFPEITPANPAGQDVRFCSSGNIYYFSDYNLKIKNRDRIIKLYSLNTNNYKIDTIEFYIPQTFDIYGKTPSELLSIKIKLPWVVFDLNPYILIYKLYDYKKNPQFITSPGFDYNQLGRITLLNGLIMDSYINYPGKPPYINLYSMDFRTKLRSIEPDFDLPEFSRVLPNHWIDSDPSGNRILFARTTSYKISIFDTLLKETYTIQKSDSCWTKITDNLRKQVISSARKDRLYELPYTDTLMSRLLCAWFASDSMIVTQYTYPQTYFGHETLFWFDIWTLQKNGKWKLKYTNLTDGRPDDNLFLTKDSYPMLSQCFYDYTFLPEKVVVLSKDANVNPLGKTFNECMAVSEKWYENNSAVLKIAIFSHSF